MPRRLRTWAPIAVAVLCSLAAADFSALQPQGYLSDFAGVVDPGSRRQIEAYAAAVERATGAQMAFVIVPTLDGEPVEDVANSLYRRWGVGSKQENLGVMLFLAVRDRRSRLEVGYGLEPILPDGAAGDVLRSMRTALRAQHYGEAMLAGAQQIGERIARSKGVQIEPTAQPRRRIQQEPTIPWPLLIGGGIFLLFLMAKGGGLPWWILYSLMSGGGRGGGWHGSSGGGFGGYDSGGGFGGFGGGDSGGGGASSDW